MSQHKELIASAREQASEFDDVGWNGWAALITQLADALEEAGRMDLEQFIPVIEVAAHNYRSPNFLAECDRLIALINSQKDR